MNIYVPPIISIRPAAVSCISAFRALQFQFYVIDCPWFDRGFCSFLAPSFVGSMEYGDHVYFFFRETAVEYINCGKVRVSAVHGTGTGGSRGSLWCPRVPAPCVITVVVF